MKRSNPPSAKRFQMVREVRRERETAQLDRFLADTDPLLIASLREEETAPPVTSLRPWPGCKPPSARLARPAGPAGRAKEPTGESGSALREQAPPVSQAVKFLVTCRPTLTPPPPEQAVALIRAAMEWIEARLADGSMETTYLFPNRGGIAIMHADSHEGLMELLLDYPAYPLYTWEVQVLADWRPGFENVMRFLQIPQGGPAES